MNPLLASQRSLSCSEILFSIRTEMFVSNASTIPRKYIVHEPTTCKPAQLVVHRNIIFDSKKIVVKIIAPQILGLQLQTQHARVQPVVCCQNKKQKSNFGARTDLQSRFYSHGPANAPKLLILLNFATSCQTHTSCLVGMFSISHFDEPGSIPDR